MKRRLVVLCLFQMSILLGMEEPLEWLVSSKHLRAPKASQEALAGDFFDSKVEETFDQISSRKGNTRKGHPVALIEPQAGLPLSQAVQLMREGDQELDTWRI